jgi:hypothetical protein
MKRTQVHVTLEQDRRLAQLSLVRGISRAGALRWALDSALETGAADAQAHEVIRATAGVLSDTPASPEWQRAVRGQTAVNRLDAADAHP